MITFSTIVSTADAAGFTPAEWTLVFALPALLVASGFFSGSETAFFSLPGGERARLVRRGGVVGALIDHLLSDPRMLLITLMVGNMTANVLYFVVSSALLLRLEEGATHGAVVALVSIAPLVGIIVFGEVLPKLVANTMPGLWVRVVAVPLDVIHRGIAPLRLILGHGVITPLSRLVAPGDQPAALSGDELDKLLELSQTRGVIDRQEEQILREVLHLGQIRVSEVMVPRVEIDAIDIRDDPALVRRKIEQTRRTKLLVHDRNLDSVRGVLYARQFLLAEMAGPVMLDKLVRGVRFVPEQQRVDQLLDQFRKTGTHFAVVVDEYGGTAGVVAVRDVVEQIVGDLTTDERPGDDEGPEVEALGRNRWRVSGRLSVHDWMEAFGQENLPDRVATVGGLVMALAGRVLSEGDTVRLGNLEMTVDRVVGRRVASVILRLHDGAGL